MTGVALGGFFKPYARKTRAYTKSISVGYAKDSHRTISIVLRASTRRCVSMSGARCALSRSYSSV